MGEYDESQRVPAGEELNKAVAYPVQPRKDVGGYGHRGDEWCGRTGHRHAHRDAGAGPSVARGDIGDGAQDGAEGDLELLDGLFVDG